MTAQIIDYNGSGGGGSTLLFDTFANLPAAGTANGQEFQPKDGHCRYVWDAALTLWRPSINQIVWGKRPPLAAAFTGVNQGVSTLADSNGALLISGDTDGSPTYHAFVMAGTTQAAIAVTLPQTPPQNIVSSNYSFVGACLLESGTGKLVMTGVTLNHTPLDGTRPVTLEYQRYTDPTTRANDDAAFPFPAMPNGPLLLRTIVIGSNVLAQVTTWANDDMAEWVTLHSIALGAAFTVAPDRVGIATMGINANPKGFILAANFA